MHYIFKDRYDKMPTDPKERKAAAEAWDKAQSLSLREAAAARREIIKRIRFERMADRPDLVAKSIAESRAIRRNMEKRINEF